jgi:hypothetical protein
LAACRELTKGLFDRGFGEFQKAGFKGNIGEVGGSGGGKIQKLPLSGDLSGSVADHQYSGGLQRHCISWEK